MMKKNVFAPNRVALAISATLLCLSTSAVASESDRINELEERLNQLEVELIEAKDAAKSTDRVKFKTGDPSPELISKDGQSTMQFTGRIQMDYVNADPFYTGDDREYTEGFDEVSFRRVRFGVEGYFSNVWKYSLEFDFDGASEVEVKDANVNYRGFENSEIKLGFQKFGYGMEATGSSKNLAFLERASTDTFSPDRAVGASWLYKGDGYNFTLGYGVTALLNDDDENEKLDVLNGRITYTPIKNSDHLLHLGASGLYTKTNDYTQKVRYRARPNTKATGRIIDTGKVKAESTQHYGIEAAYQHRNLLIQGEYAIAKTDAVEGEESISVNAGYIQAVYTLTGEKWGYSGKKGVFKTAKPDNAISAGGWGAWELAARIDIADFTDTDAGVDGGKKTDYVLGVNWYLENNLKAQFNYVHTQADYETAFEDINGNMVYEQDGNVFQARLQYAF
ncbi:carbohydrate porin [Shewanella sp. WXL01]|uniref:Porin n=1 Tax=Shewanella maritima TaxID=2520507 RepID=A0A411PH21_9GAMM|nr:MULTISPECIES: porin [Shewanella]NKF48973.1 carbohydrate porin [Shewanella sp. WXL01]QBF82881.1 porin [Shewanella maritima]